MALGPRLDLRQSQSLVMTPQLQQAIKLLALSNLEVEAFIAEEIEKNPLLDGGGEAAEREPGDTPDEGHDDDGFSADGFGGDDEEWDGPTADRLIEAGDAAADAPLDADYDAETFHHDSAADSARGPEGPGLDGVGSGGGSEERPDLDEYATATLSLHDHLTAQAGELLSGHEMAIAARIIDLIDEAGYFEGQTLEIAQLLDVPLFHVERILSVIQTLDPSGVGARTLAECIAIQAREADRYDPAMAKLIDNLDLLARGAIPQLRRLCGVDEEDMADMIRELRDYDPKPGLRFGGEPAAPVTPDIFVHRTANGWAVELNNATLPRLIVNRSYYSELSSGPQDKGSKAWLSECLASANWLVKALDQRARTIVKVAREIVKQQEAFFLHGVEHLRPLTLKAVADAIGMHESTISRVTSNKYLMCERGLHELKYFFTSGVAAADGGDAVSAEAVKSQIAKLIAAEGDDILSDDKLVELLKEKGFDLARRTVAKYREAIGLGSSVQRRRQRAMKAA
ncbi:RNA polymerase factor sigma-54 [Rhizorhabdus dicambivorans]|uniref:RNA polymerase sigma-54 factor n=1 Tax=Rhizorhabdus dicambivorans TaxID=1850238 RepID=A0A2A4G0T6_9SPHN|nr:RNA polymerase factor sigma-54 [Rhizorhabdus dicambivorans]ATE63385.1 RNA polymerase sigma-54 factor [Rhizorhabdus dicambivorans]PCE43601.1 RNA polymerase sigma-54 factor [Rhizorhabdus dicambivorans]